MLENTVCLLTGKEVSSTVEKQIQENDNGPQIRAILPFTLIINITEDPEVCIGRS
jgi:hypothetical protein